MIFTCEGKIICEITKWEKPNETRDNLWNQDKTGKGQTELKRRKKKKSNRVKDYRRLKSVNENERKVQKKKNEKKKKRLN